VSGTLSHKSINKSFEFAGIEVTLAIGLYSNLLAGERTMKLVNFAIFTTACLIYCEFGIAQHPADPYANFHAGIHSGSWTLKREQLLEAESQDPHRSCSDPYCARCAKHLADYGHEYQYLHGPSQRQIWYRGTAGTVAIVTQRGYDQHGFPYLQRGQPAAIISKEYLQVLNHAIWEQVNARNAVAIEEAAQDRVTLLTKLLEDAKEQLHLTKEAWEQLEHIEKPCSQVHTTGKIVVARCKTYKQFCIEMKAGRYEIAKSGMCVYCLAQSRYLFDQAYVADVENELALAQKHWTQTKAVATEAVRLALLSKSDADKATRFKRLQYKPPKYQEVLAAMQAVEDQPEEDSP
jgi:hypothetical protein